MESKPESKEERPASATSKTTGEGNQTAANTEDSQDAVINPEDKTKPRSTYTDMASSAATSATAAAAGVKDNVFSMFGGGAKKERKEEPTDDQNEASGSSKATRAAEAAEAEKEGEPGEVRFTDPLECWLPGFMH